MNILALDSALNKSYLALEFNNEIKSEIIESDQNYHSLYLIEKIKNFMKDKSFNELDFLAVNIGPGSFTGIRVALTIAKVISGEINLPIVGLNTSEILLEAYDCDLLVMDARRDMYYVGDRKNITLIKKEEIQNHIIQNKIVCDKRSMDIKENSICFEDEKNSVDIGKVILKLAKDKWQKTQDKSQFNPALIQANYIQTPPIFGKI
ncbi:tRNA (adenosine(37)-N6)-threonylcarbamoyltransferase complex dimerization subunit type 1 TsaB [bacterium]|nr:tRNA (adenosine(37)-N6)-threonylcarbamoyltransferase complex dimerization subunit type 1 TsaB [bacterium]